MHNNSPKFFKLKHKYKGGENSVRLSGFSVQVGKKERRVVMINTAPYENNQ